MRLATSRRAARAAPVARCNGRTKLCARADAGQQQAQTAAAAAARAACTAAAAVSLLLGGLPSPAAASLASEAYERELGLKEQESKLEYMLEQAANAKKATIAGQRKAVENATVQAQTALAQKKTEEEAARVAALKKGDNKTAAAIAKQEVLIEKKELAVAKAASQAQAKLAREELLVKAKEVAAKQGLERAVQAADGDVNVKLDKWLQSIAAMK